MGTCHNCGVQLTLKKDEIICDNCGKVIEYPCHNCKQWFPIDKAKLCKVCGFYICPNCGVCGEYCLKDEWVIKLRKVLNKNIDTEDKIKELIDWIENVKLNKKQMNCPRGVPISYAKSRIKRCIVKLKGYKIKNKLDLEKFKERIDKIIKKDLGTTFTINQSREAGSYGQEYRDVCNYLLCEGKLEKKKIRKIIDGEEREIEIYKRVEKGTCPKLDTNKLIIKVCTNPKCTIKEFPLSQTECCYCRYKNGNKKGQFYPLKLKISNKDICQLPRGEFKKEEDEKIQNR